MKIKILFVINTLSVGGAELHLLNVIRLIDKKKYDVSLVYFNEASKSSRSLLVDFSDIDSLKIYNFKIFTFFSFIEIYKFYKFIHKMSFDVIQTLLFKADFFGIIFGFMCKTQLLIASVHDNSLFAHHRSRIFFILGEWIMNYIYSIADVVIVISKSIEITVKNKYPRVNANRIKLVYYGSKEIKHSKSKLEMRNELGYSSSDFIVGAIGRLDTNKGHIFLIKAVEQLIHTNKDVKLLIAGHDDYGLGANLKNYIKSHSLGEYIKLIGYRSDVGNIFQALDVFVMPSLNEGLGLVVIEAMLSSRAIVASNAGALPELIFNNQTGLLFDPGNIDAIFKSIQKLYKNRSLIHHLGQNAKIFAQDNFSETTMINKLDCIYTNGFYSQ